MNTPRFNGITPRDLIKKLEALPENQKDLPIMTYEQICDELIPVNLNPKEAELITIEMKYKKSDETYFIVTEVASLYPNSPGFVREVRREKVLIV